MYDEFQPKGMKRDMNHNSLYFPPRRKNNRKLIYWERMSDYMPFMMVLLINCPSQISPSLSLGTLTVDDIAAGHSWLVLCRIMVLLKRKGSTHKPNII